MIISHEYKFIFIKTNKTAGTSIEIALSKFCGPEDIITPINKSDELIRKKLGYRGPQNIKDSAPLFEYTFEDFKNLILNFQKKPRFYNHISASQIKKLVDPNMWDDYFKFCVERNPWDRIISHYHWINKSRKQRQSMQAYLKSSLPLLLKKRGYNLYTINDQIVVDKVCFYENLEQELEEVRRHLGIPEKIELPKAKTGVRDKNVSYKELINEEDAKTIGKLFKEEINLFNYSF